MSARIGVKQQVQVWLAAAAVLGLGGLLSCGDPAVINEPGRAEPVALEPLAVPPTPTQLEPMLASPEPSPAEAPPALPEHMVEDSPAPPARCEPGASGEPVLPILASEDGAAWVCPEAGEVSFSDGYAPIHRNPVFSSNADGTVTSLGTLELHPPFGKACPQGLLEEVVPLRGGACFLEFHFDTDCCDASGEQGVRLRCAVGENALNRPNQTLEVILTQTRVYDVLHPRCLDALAPDGDLRECYDRMYETSDRRDFFLVEDGDAELLCVGPRDGIDSTRAEAWRLSEAGIEKLLDLPSACDGLSPAVPEERRR